MRFPNSILLAKAIWLNADGLTDEYADFYPSIEFKSGKKYTLRIVCDTDRAVYLDGALVSFGQYADYPDTPVYEDIVLPARKGSKLKITVWHSGINSQTHVATEAYAAFCIYEDGEVICSSSESTPVRPNPEYVPHLNKIITSQMGAGFALYGRGGTEKLKNAVVKDIEISSLRPRPIKPLYLATPIKAKIVREGFCSFPQEGDTACFMSNAELDTEKKAGCGKYYLFDLGTEAVGFPEISFKTEFKCDVMIGWGEHIKDGMCRSAIHSRRFTTEIGAHSGENHYFPVLRRFGMRYMQIFFTSPEISDVSLTFHPTLLPVEVKKQEFFGEKSELRKQIRSTAIHTLLCCMHEHYEDCPWREQALYTLDSRNQMLAGYEVFKDKNADFARANLDLISRGVRQDGILALCYPAGLDYPIPFYTLAYFMQMDEYIKYTGDISLAEEKYDILVSLLDVFYNRCDKNGLVKRFPDSEGYWNFYEWSKYLSGDRVHKHTPAEALPYEAILNASLSIASSSMADICKALGKNTEAALYAEMSEKVSKAIAKVFFNPKTGFFFDFTDRPDIHPSVLTQAMCLLCGAADGLPKKNMLEAVAANGGIVNGTEVIPATLSMACFRYDALLRSDAAKFKNIILDEIDRDCGYMLENGATTFWETLKGEADFGGAGSLCHGWSAMAAYYYSKLL